MALLTNLALLLVVLVPSDSLQASASTERVWSAPSKISTDMPPGPGGPYSVVFAMNGGGDSIAVWLRASQSGNSPSYNVLADLFSKDKGWGTPIVLDATWSPPGYPDVAIDAQGNAIVVWEHCDAGQDDNDPIIIQADRFSHGAGWTAKSSISPVDKRAFGPRIAFDALGNAFVVWGQTDQDGTNATVWSNRYQLGTGWLLPQRLDTSNSSWVGQPNIAVDPGGVAIATWSQDADAASTIWTNRYSYNSWGLPEQIGAGMYPEIAVDAAGHAIVVWFIWNGAVSSILSSRYTPGGGWSGTVIDTLGEWGSGVFMPNIAMNPSGDAIIAWDRMANNAFQVFASRYDHNSGWAGPIPVGSPAESRSPGHDLAIDSSGNAFIVWDKMAATSDYPGPPCIWAARFTPSFGGEDHERPLDLGTGIANGAQIGIDSQGNAVMVWQQDLRAGSGLWWNTYSIDRGWGNASVVEFAPSTMTGLQVASYGDGNAVAMWSRADGTHSIIWADSYHEGTGWRRAAPIASNGDMAYNPALGADPAGNVISVWEQWNGSRYSVWSSRYRYGIGWSASEMIDDGTGHAFSPLVASDRNGNAIAMWKQWNGSGINLWANRFDARVGWGNATLIGFGIGSAPTPKIEMDDMGNAIVVWASGPNLLAKRYTIDMGWSPPENIGPTMNQIGVDTLGIFGARPADAAFDEKGNALVVWQLSWWNYSGGASGIWANRFEPTIGWLGPKEVFFGTTGDPQIAMSAISDALILWQPALGWGDFGPAFTTRYIEGSTWGEWNATLQVDVTDSNYSTWARNPRIAMDASGNAVSIWRENHDGVLQLWANNYSSGVGWGFPVQISENRSLDWNAEPEIAFDDSGNAIVVWLESEGGCSSIWSSRYELFDENSGASIVVPDITFLRWVAIVNFIGVIVLAMVVVKLFRMHPRGARSMNCENTNDVHTLDSSANVGQGNSARNGPIGNGILSNGLGQDKRWPAKALTGPVRLTAKERILLHLLHFARYTDSPEVPRELTQERIAEAAGIDRRHFTQYVHPLEGDGLVRERTTHVRGAVQRRRVYVLTEEGERRTLSVRDRVRSAVVRVRDLSGERDVTVAEALLEARGSMSVLDIIRESIETGVVDLTRSASSARDAGSDSASSTLEMAEK